MTSKPAPPQRQNLRQSVFIYNLRTVYIPAALVFLLALTVLYTRQVYLPWRTGEDLQGAVLHSGTGEVVGPADVLTGYKTSVAGVNIRINGQNVQAKFDMPVRIGQQVKVLYRLGKSGIIYVDHIQSL